MQYGKVPPSAVQIEKVVLGAIMLEADVIDIAMEYLTPESFYDSRHEVIFSVMVTMRNNMRKIDMLTVVDELVKQNKIELAESPHYVVSLTNFVTSSAHVEEHCQILKQKFVYRRMIEIGSQILTQAYAQELDAFDLMDKTSEHINALALNSFTQTGVALSDLMVKSLQRIVQIQKQLAANEHDIVTGVPSGYITLDRVTRGWQKGDLIIIAARPSVGKTAFALNLARNAAMHGLHPTKVGLFELEMDSGKVSNRIMSAQSGINYDLIENGTISDSEMKLLYDNGVQPLFDAGVYVDDTPALSILEIRAKARRWVKKFGVGLIIVDYLQLMTTGKSDDRRNREQEISLISRSLKALAKELHVPVIALSQMSREIEKQNRDPQLSDLRESGAIEQDADVVIFLTRPDYQKERKDVDPTLRDIAECFIRKNRNGELKKIIFRVLLRIQRWFTPTEYDTFIKNYYDDDTPF